MSNNTNGANANVGGGQDGRESIHMADLATIRVNGLQALTPAVKAEIMQYWFEEQLGKMGYEYDVNVSRAPPFLPRCHLLFSRSCFAVKRAVCAKCDMRITKANADTYSGAVALMPTSSPSLPSHNSDSPRRTPIPI
jgi:hypothetical protein